jgi:hypothetical protein
LKQLRVIIAATLAIIVSGGLVAAEAATTPRSAAAAPAPSRFDLDGDGLDEIVTTGATGSSRVLVIDYSRPELITRTIPLGSDLQDGRNLAAGDFNGDGFSDLAVGDPIRVPRGGAVWVFYGSANGVDPAHPVMIDQESAVVPGDPQREGYFGDTLAAGDFNHDGLADLAVGAPQQDVGDLVDAGAVTILYGGATGLSGAGAVLFTQDSPGVPGASEANDYFGWALAAGDVTGDGYVDLAIDSLGEVVGEHGQVATVTLLRGSAAGLTGAGATSVNGYAVSRPSPAVSVQGFGKDMTIADTNGDGRAEVIVGAPFTFVGAATTAGAVVVLRGTAAGISATGAVVITQNTPGVPGVAEFSDYFGARVAAGDVTGDGLVDLLVASPYETIGSASEAGYVTLLRGTASGLTGVGATAFSQNTAGVPGVAEKDDWFGWAISLLNLDGDGHLDAIVGSPNEATAVGYGLLTSFVGGPAGLTPVRAWTGLDGCPSVLYECAGQSFGAQVLTG